MMRCIFALLVFSLPATKVQAQTHYDYAVDGSITLGLLAVTGGLQLFSEELVGGSCRWCATNTLDEHTRTAVLWRDPQRAVFWSNVALGSLSGLSVVPFLFTGTVRDSTDRFHRIRRAVLITAEALAVNLVLVQAVKRIAQRERPYVRTLPDADQGTDPDHYSSFFSGHSAMAFTIGISMATMLRLEGLADHCWWYAAAAGMASLVAYFRMAGDKHYLTDVAVGALVGTLVGISIPLLHKGRRRRGPSFWAGPLAHGGLVGVAWSY